MKRIEFLTQDDPLYILPLFNELFVHYSGEFEVTQVSCCRTMGSRSRRRLASELWQLYGPLGFARLGTRVLLSKVFAPLPAPRGRARYWSMHQLCRAYGVTFCRIGNPNAESFVAGLQQRAPDVIVSVACPYILKEPVLNTPPLGCINVHHATLPNYQGMMPTFWQLFNGESAVGLTVHYMTPKIDVGTPLLQERLPVEPGESLDELIRRSKKHAAHCLARVLHDLSPGLSTRIPPQPAAAGSYFTFPTAEQIREFHRKGLRAI